MWQRRTRGYYLGKELRQHIIHVWHRRTRRYYLGKELRQHIINVWHRRTRRYYLGKERREEREAGRDLDDADLGGHRQTDGHCVVRHAGQTPGLAAHTQPAVSLPSLVERLQVNVGTRVKWVRVNVGTHVYRVRVNVGTNV